MHIYICIYIFHAHCNLSKLHLVTSAVDELKGSTNCSKTQKRTDPKLSRLVGQPSPCRQQTIAPPSHRSPLPSPPPGDFNLSAVSAAKRNPEKGAPVFTEGGITSSNPR